MGDGRARLAQSGLVWGDQDAILVGNPGGISGQKGLIMGTLVWVRKPTVIFIQANVDPGSK